MKFDEKSSSHTLSSFTPFRDHKSTNATHVDSPGLYTSDKIFNLSTIDKIHLKCDIIDGSVVNGLRQPILYSFILIKPPGYKVFCEPETIHYKKINKSVLKTITFYSDDSDNKEANFHQETLKFKLQLIEV